jgi:hypothetical protein
MNDKDKKALADFLTDEKLVFTEMLSSFLQKLSLRVDFSLKIQKASIQLINNAPFAVFAFRRKRDYFFVEFYSDIIINDESIVKTNIVDKSKIIHTINVCNGNNLEDRLLGWIEKSHSLTK